MQITRNCALCIQLILILVFRSPSNVLAQNASGTISGTVFDALTNQPIPNMIINFYQVREDGTSYYFEPSIKTDINGRYSVQFSPSGYKVSFGVADFMPDCIRHSLIISATYCNPVFYDNADTAATATTISLTSSTIATNINGQLLQSQPVSLTVQVLDIDTLQPISGVMISIYGVLPDMQTGSDGKATNTLLRPNHDILIRIQTSPASPANEYIYTSEWSTVHMGTTDVVIKVYLTHERYLQGTITDKQTGQPLRTTISAKCYDSTVKCIDYNYRSIENNADGSYRLRLIPGQNEISVSTAAFDRRYIDYVTSTLISTAITTNLDVKLEVGGQIAGQLIMPEVIDPQDSELFFAYFTYFILDAKTGQIVGEGYFSNNSQQNSAPSELAYISNGLPTGTYKISFDMHLPCTRVICRKVMGHLLPYFDNKITLATADVVTVTTPQVSTAINGVYTYTNLANFFPFHFYLPVIEQYTN